MIVLTLCRALDPESMNSGVHMVPVQFLARNQAPLVRNPKKPQKEEEEVVLAILVGCSEGLELVHEET